MITTRDIEDKKDDKEKELKIKTTKTVEVKYIDKKGPPKPTKISVSTHNIHEIQAMAKARERQELTAKILKQRAAAKAKKKKKEPPVKSKTTGVKK